MKPGSKLIFYLGIAFESADSRSTHFAEVTHTTNEEADVIIVFRNS